MSKSEVNNEFILLRHAVRQARVCTINKLIREAKLLRDRHGDEAQREKCRKKADKLIDEVFALKTIKDDEISKFGILDERNLPEILQDQSSSTGVRIMARVTHYKTLNKRLTQFKERFPDCKKYLAETDKKKKTTKRNKSAAKTRKSERNNAEKGLKKQKVEKVEQSSCNKDDESCNKELSEARSSSRKRKKTLNEDGSSTKEQKLIKLEKDSTSEVTVADKQSNIIKQSNVTKEATVKKFADLLEEQETNEVAQTSAENKNSSGTTTEQVNMVDDFFITGNEQDCQGNASTSYTRSLRLSTRTKTFQTNDRMNKQSGNRKGDTNFRKENSGQQFSSVKPNKKICNRMNKSINKNNANENVIVDKKDGNSSSNLHPSWMAKKKEQEIMSKGFQGKKIVFTDD
ncbi:hypothetical protein PUN28_005682 [Cardiocondyla obscurior]|uniref:Serum response factor-binding protein 1 n=1 Tax=Cardiocondyla obscurior TaxID=286306 RepID=A0AAW2G6S3_9HYME